MLAFCPEHHKWEQNLKFTPLSETTRIPTPFICGVPPSGVSPLSVGKVVVTASFIKLFLEGRGQGWVCSTSHLLVRDYDQTNGPTHTHPLNKTQTQIPAAGTTNLVSDLWYCSLRTADVFLVVAFNSRPEISLLFAGYWFCAQCPF